MNRQYMSERYSLNWVGKRDITNVLNKPVNARLVECRDESVNFDDTENIFIEGDNLDALKLLKKSYIQKVKMIYIDPPYNTGRQFIYSDRHISGLEVKDCHSGWLNMMYPRLVIARELMRDDGVIFVSIDDNEVHNLRFIMDEIFGEKNFIGCLIRKSASNRAMAKKFNVLHEYILCYAKFIHNISLYGEKKDLNIYKNPDNDPNGPWVATNSNRKGGYVFEFINPYTGKIEKPPKGRGWVFKPDELDTLIKEGKLVFLREHKEKQRSFILKRYLSENKSEYKLVTSLDTCNNDFLNQNGTKEIIKLFNALYFDYPKPVFLIKYLLKISTNSSDLILDFFAGSGTTGQAVLELNAEEGTNRRFILVQLDEKVSIKSEAYKDGFLTIADIAKERLRRVCNRLIDKREVLKDSGFKVFKIEKTFDDN